MVRSGKFVITTTFLDAAQNYARELHWPIFPIEEMGKQPKITGGRGCKEATTNADVIKGWWAKYPNANLGVHCTKFWVLDIDTAHNGDLSLAGLEKQYGPLPDTLRAQTGSGGTHYLFNYIDGVKIKNSSGFYPGLDTRAYGGYIVLAPSIHMSGEPYSWLNWGTPICDPPTWLINLVKDDRKGFQLPERSDPGTRDVDDASLAGHLHNIGMTPEEVFNALNFRNNDPNRRAVPLPSSEILKTVRSITSRDIRTPSALLNAIHENSLRKLQEKQLVKVDPDWNERLVGKNAAGIAKNLLANAEILLTYSPIFANALGYNQLTTETVLVRNIVDPTSDRVLGDLHAGAVVTDHITRQMLALSQRMYGEVTFTNDTFGEGIMLVAQNRPFNPLQDYLNGLAWDGKPRVETWLIDHLGVVDDSDGYARGIGQRWLISAVGRALDPGCKADCMLIIEGPQGCGKSPALRNLCGVEWFKDSGIDFKSKDKFGAVKGCWVYEMSEFDQYKGHDAAVIKNFLSSQFDTFRPPYARSDVKHPRVSIFAGTTNEHEYLVDNSGAKRFWPVRVVRHTAYRPIDQQFLLAERDQIWAEAVVLYLNGAAGFIDTAELIDAHKRETSERYETDDTWESAILAYMHSHLGKKPQITTTDILTHAIVIPLGKQTKKEQQRARAILERSGFAYKLIRTLDKRVIKTWATK